MICDMHTHSLNSHDSKCPVSQTARVCIQKGIDVFAVTDHCDIQYYNTHGSFERIRNSIRDVQEENEKLCGKVKILKGIEIGEALWNKDNASEILSANDYDVVIGSVHQIKSNFFPVVYSLHDFSKNTADELSLFMSCYFEDVLETVSTVPCDIMAHLTCPLRYICGKYGRNFDLTTFDGIIKQILAHIISKSIALEVNTSCLSTAYDNLMPDERIISIYAEMGGKLVTLGSDAHVAQNVGKGFDKAIETLKKHGIDKCCYYTERKAVMYDI